MANITITSTTNCVIADFGNYSANLGFKKELWHKASVHFKLAANESFATIQEDNGTELNISIDGEFNTMQIDSVDGVAPTSNSDLFNKLSALLG